MKKLLLSAAAVAALATGSVRADMPSSNMGGFYIGLAAGIANNYLDLKNTFSNGDPATGYSQVKLGNSSAVFNLYTGYGKFWGNFYAGLEGNFGLNTLLQKFTILSVSGQHTTGQYKSPWHGGVSVRLGRSVFSQQALVYLGLGVQFEGHELKYSGLEGTLGASWRKKFTTTHFVPSLGIEGMITERMTMRFQVDYDIPVKKSFNAPSTQASSARTFPQTLKVSSVVAKVGIGYKF